MHRYSTDISNRTKIIAILGAIALGTIFVIQQFLPMLTNQLPFGIPLSAPSFAVLFGLLYGGFNRYLWRHTLFHRVGVVKVPDLNGSWTGYIETSYSGELAEGVVSDETNSGSGYQRLDASLVIEQRWRDIIIHFETTTSSSDSRGATILVNESVWSSLTYQYENQPPPDTPESMQMHHGTADLELKEENQVLEGVYYTGPGRRNHGKMFLRRN